MLSETNKNSKIDCCKMSSYIPSELMNTFEAYSNVWNDCPEVQNPIQNHSHHQFKTVHQNSLKHKHDEKYIRNELEYNKRHNKYGTYNNNSDTKLIENKWDINNTKKLLKQSADHLITECVQYKESSNNALQSINTPPKELSKSAKYDSNLADLKRKKAVLNQRQLQVDKKNIIKQALSSLDSNHKVNTKIVFTDAKKNEDYHQKTINNDHLDKGKKKDGQLFQDDDSESEIELKLNHQFEGKKGKKLLELQSKFASDSRFNLDSRFHECESDESEHETQQDGDNSEEKQKQLAILESIIKRQIKPLSEIKTKTTKRNWSEDTMFLRFDPSREEHNKYIINRPEPTKDKEDNTEKINKKKKKSNNEQGKSVEENKNEVSTEQFFTMKEDFKEVLKGDSGDKFSLLKLFGSKETESSKSNDEVIQNVEKPRHSSKNPFKYDSSESEAEVKKERDKKEKRSTKPSTVSWKTTFFFTDNDPRLQEAFDFLRKPGEPEDTQEYAEKRKILKDFIRNKFRNNKRKKGMFKKKLGGFKKNSYFKKKSRSK